MLSVKYKQVCKIVAFNLAFIVILLSLIELALHRLMSAPTQIPSGTALNAMRTLYWLERDRDLIQFSPGCAQHHPALGYILRPGSCTFSGPEFSNTFRVNSLGLRDDEQSLEAPEIIVLGDSHAMGWGVEQDETFAQVIEARRSTRVLNAAVSSYGTAREVLSLQRLDTSRLKTLLIQHDDNDVQENAAFYQSDNHLVTMDAARYAEVSNAQRKMTEYYFGRELKFIAGAYAERLKQLIKRVSAPRSQTQGGSQSGHGSVNPGRPALNEAGLFLNVLDHGGTNLRDVEIIVFEISNYGRSGHRFFSALQSSLQSPDRRSSPLNIKVIDAASLLGPEHYYRLDGHLNAAGHRVLADTIVALMTPVSSR